MVRGKLTAHVGLFAGEQGNRVRSEVHAANVQERSQRYRNFYLADFTLQLLGRFVTHQLKHLSALRVYDGDDSQLQSYFTYTSVKIAELLHLLKSRP